MGIPSLVLLPENEQRELVMFKTYDSSENPFVPTLHSAFDDQTILDANVSPREVSKSEQFVSFLMESNSGTYS